jgi:uridine phosphorylase
MEAETIVIVGEAVGMKAGVLLAVHGNRGTDTWLEAYEETQDYLIRIAYKSVLLVRS